MCRNCEVVGLRPEDVPPGAFITTFIDPNTGRTLTYVNGKRWKRKR